MCVGRVVAEVLDSCAHYTENALSNLRADVGASNFVKFLWL